MATWKKVLTESDITTSHSLGTSDTLVPSQDAVKQYVDTEVSGVSYTLPLSASGTRGGVKIGYSENGKNYPVELSNEKMYVNVPWTDTDTNTQLSTEQVQDIVGAMFSSNTETRISASYVDGDGTIDLVVDDMTANDNDDVSVENLKTALAGGFGSNAVQIGDTDDVVTIGNDLIVTGDLTVSGDTTTINTTQLNVQDKIIMLANNTQPSTTTATDSGIQIESDAVTSANWPEFKWTKDKGGGNTNGAGTANGLTGWTLSNHRTSNQADHTIAIMDFTTSAGSGNSAGVGSFILDTSGENLYIRTA